MSDALIFVLRSLAELYIITFVLRLILQWVRADFHNPLSQFLLKVTDPLVVPLRRVVPPVGRIDTATLLIAVALQAVLVLVLVNLACLGSPNPAQILSLAVLGIVRLVLRLYFFVIIAYVILSWVAPGTYNPVASLLSSMAEPVLAPLRRIIPPIGGIDLSPLFAIIGLQALTMLLPIGRVMSGLLCTSAVGQPF